MNNKLFKCWDCSEEISKNAKACPHCGRLYSKKEMKKIRKKRKTSLISYMLLVIIIIILTPKENNVSSIDIQKKEEIKNWDSDFSSDYEKQQYLDLISKLSNSEKKVSLKEFESQAVACQSLLPLVNESINKEKLKLSKNFCYKFMNQYYKKTLEETKKSCLDKSVKKEKNVIEACDKFISIYYK